MKENSTIGMDISDQKITICMLDAAGQKQKEEESIVCTARAVRALFARHPGAVVAMETGTHSRWISQLGNDSGMTVLVGNARKLRAIWSSQQKSDIRDAEMLARIARFDPQLMCPIQHRSVQAHQDLALIKARDRLVRCRASLIVHVRSVVKVFGHRLASGGSQAFARKAMIPEELRPVLDPLLETVAHLGEQIRVYDRKIKETARTYPETARLEQIHGVGTLTALAYVLTLEDAKRFEDSRTTGAYLGLVPKRDQSGETDKQLRITKEGNEYLRRLLVGCAHYILGPFGKPCDLRRHGERLMERGGKNAKKRAVVAVARKLAVLLHALWRTESVYEPDRHLQRAA